MNLIWLNHGMEGRLQYKMKISIVGLKDYIKDNVIRGVQVHGVCLEPIASNGYGNEIFKEYLKGFDGSNFEVGEVYEVEFEQYKTKEGYAARVVGLRKENE